MTPQTPPTTTTKIKDFDSLLNIHQPVPIPIHTPKTPLPWFDNNSPFMKKRRHARRCQKKSRLFSAKC